jgi:hypothetical protein
MVYGSADEEAGRGDVINGNFEVDDGLDDDDVDGNFRDCLGNVVFIDRDGCVYNFYLYFFLLSVFTCVNMKLCVCV